MLQIIIYSSMQKAPYRSTQNKLYRHKENRFDMELSKLFTEVDGVMNNWAYNFEERHKASMEGYMHQLRFLS